MPRKIEISHRTIIFTVFFLLGLWFLFYIRDIILQIFVALLIMTILNPTVTKLQRYKIPRAVSVIIVYFLLILGLIFSIVTLIPALVEQTANFSTALPNLLEDLNIPVFIVEQATRDLTSQIGALPSQILRISVSIFSNALALLATMFFALYFLLGRNSVENKLGDFLPSDQVKKIDHILHRLEKELGGWATGQIILMAMVGVTTYIGLLILGIPYALPLALLAAIFEIIPNIGPILSAIPAVLVGFGISPFTGAAVAALGFLIQQVENYVFVPKVMERSANVSPVVTLLSLVIGFRVAGIVGAILSVPIVITSRVIFSETIWKKSS